MLERGSGAIVNNASVLGWRAQEGQSHYAAAKAGVMALTRCAAIEAAERGVRINCVAPGWIVPHEADHVGEGSFWKKYGYEFFGTPEQMAKTAEAGEALFNVESQPIRRIGRPEDIANLALFLASECAAHITGQLVSVSGGAYMP